MIRFYAPDIETTGKLPEVESGHCIRVLRMREGDVINVTDGKGNVFDCRIAEANPHGALVEIIEKRADMQSLQPRIVLAVAPTKNIDRMEWLVEKAVEIGVSEIVMVQCARSERKVVKRERLEKILVSAAKQSLKTFYPAISEMMPFKAFLKNVDTPSRFMGYCDDSVDRKNFVTEYNAPQDVTILIGPEGDFTPDEVRLAFESGFAPVTFGEMRLRTETAALYALTAVHVLNDLRKISKI